MRECHKGSHMVFLVQAPVSLLCFSSKTERFWRTMRSRFQPRSLLSSRFQKSAVNYKTIRPKVPASSATQTVVHCSFTTVILIFDKRWWQRYLQVICKWIIMCKQWLQWLHPIWLVTLCWGSGLMTNFNAIFFQAWHAVPSAWIIWGSLLKPIPGPHSRRRELES